MLNKTPCIIIVFTIMTIKGKSKGKAHPVTDYKDPEVE